LDALIAVLTVVALFILGPLVLGGFVAVLVVPTVYLALRSKVRDPKGLPAAMKKDPQGNPG
jgi:hypothetical protein